MTDRGQGPLSGIRILDLTRVLAAPYATMALGELGAEVIKVEAPGIGDETRGWGPPFVHGESAYFLSINRNKQSVAIDLGTEAGQGIVRHMALHWADVVVENFRPGRLARWNLELEALRRENPRLITASLRGYPEGDDRPGYDFVIQGAAGVMSLTGPEAGPPSKVGVAIADVVAGLFLLSGIEAALYRRERTGQGEHVSISLFEATLAWLVNAGQSYLLTGSNPRRLGNAHPQLAPYEVFDAADGPFTIGVGNDRQFRALADVLAHPEWADDPRFLHNDLRVEHRVILRDAINSVTAERPQAEWILRLNAAGIPAGPIRSLEAVFAGEEVAMAQAVVTLEHPAVGPLPQVRLPWHFQGASAAPQAAPPRMGQHTVSVLEGLGFSTEVIRSWVAQGIVAGPPPAV